MASRTSSALNKAKVIERVHESSAAELARLKKQHDEHSPEAHKKAVKAWAKEVCAQIQAWADGGGEESLEWKTAPTKPIYTAAGRNYLSYDDAVKTVERKRDEALRFLDLIDGDTISYSSNDYPPYRYFL